MKSKYLVISKNGKIIEPEKFLQNKNISENMKVLIQREYLRENIKANNSGDYQYFANKLGFGWENYSDLGHISYDYKGEFIMKLVKEYARQVVHKIGFPVYEVRGSNFWNLKHSIVESYAKLYGDRLYKLKSGKENLVMSYDSSYPQFNLAHKYNLSYKQLPFAHFSLSDCYRHEQRGECMLLFRNRRFFMPDLHPYFKNLNEAWDWYPKIEKQIRKSFNDLKIDFVLNARVSSENNFSLYKEQLIQICKNNKKDMLVEIIQDKDFYWIVNIDYSIIDSFKQVREISCIQIDVKNAELLDVFYVDDENKKNYPVIIHSAGIGGLERYVYMLMDNFISKFPLWLYPIQLRLVPVSERHVEFCEKLLKKFLKVRIDIDDRAESVGKKIRLAKEELIPNIFVIGDKEIDSDLSELKILIKNIKKQCKDKPFLENDWPKKVSMQV